MDSPKREKYKRSGKTFILEQMNRYIEFLLKNFLWTKILGPCLPLFCSEHMGDLGKMKLSVGVLIK